MNIDMITWECDYPHSDSTWPQSPEQFMKQMQAAHASDEDIDKISHANAMRLFNYDPFTTLGGRENCTSARCGHRPRAGTSASSPAASRPPAPVRWTCSTSPGRQGQVARQPADSTGSPGVVAQARHQPLVAQRPQGPFLVGVDHHRVARFPVDDERDDAVVAGVGARHHAVATVDRPHRDPLMPASSAPG